MLHSALRSWEFFSERVIARQVTRHFPSYYNTYYIGVYGRYKYKFHIWCVLVNKNLTKRSKECWTHKVQDLVESMFDACLKTRVPSSTSVFVKCVKVHRKVKTSTLKRQYPSRRTKSLVYWCSSEFSDNPSTYHIPACFVAKIWSDNAIIHCRPPKQSSTVPPR